MLRYFRIFQRLGSIEKLGGDYMGLICRSDAHDSGSVGAQHGQKRLERDSVKNAMELAGYRQQLRR